MILASIDIGSNAGRLHIADLRATENTVLKTQIAFVRVPLRLGIDVFTSGKIGTQRFAYLVKTLQAFQQLIELYQPQGVMACATAAMREAKNGLYLAELAEKICGIKINIIDGLEEARLIRSTAQFPVPTESDYTIMVDLGGGSTEITLLKGEEDIASQSFKVGTIRLMHNKIPRGEWKRVREWIKQHLPPKATISMVGSGGNISKLTKMYGAPALSEITKEQLIQGYEMLSAMTVDERIEKLFLKEDRADVIVYAAEIFMKLMDYTHIDKVLAPKIGLSDGIHCELFRKLESELSTI